MSATTMAERTQVQSNPFLDDAAMRRNEALAAENQKPAAKLRDLKDKVVATSETDEQLRVRFAMDRALQEEFTGVAAYLAYMHNQCRAAQSEAFQRRLALCR
jgi:uncharacterized protein YqfA (UPF0365 family)